MCPSPDDPSSRLTCVSGAPLLDEFSSEERGLLLRLAHQAISATLEQREISLAPPSPHLAEPRGAFTTLYYRGDLRGCVGYVFPVASLYRTVAESARGAAFDDSRFPPVTRDHAPELRSLPQRALAAASGSAGTSGNWTPRLADHPGLLSRPVAAASAGRARMGPHRLPRTDLQESRLAAKCLANRRQAGGLHRRGLCRIPSDPLKNVSLREEDRPLADDPDESKDPYANQELSVPGFLLGEAWEQHDGGFRV